jgi:hypothetical protein
VMSRRRLWRFAVLAGAAGFLLAALLALAVARIQPTAGWRTGETPAAQTR